MINLFVTVFITMVSLIKCFSKSGGKDIQIYEQTTNFQIRKKLTFCKTKGNKHQINPP